MMAGGVCGQGGCAKRLSCRWVCDEVVLQLDVDSAFGFCCWLFVCLFYVAKVEQMRCVVSVDSILY